jgi:hypothetical protein
MRVKEECEKLSNYMMYLMVVHPSMLPVSTASEDLQSALVNWVHGDSGQVRTKLDSLDHYTSSVLCNEPDSGSPFKPDGPFQLEESLKEIKEMWLRLLMCAAGKCRGELHARQLGEGGELITSVWLLMVHHGLGDVATELSLLTSDDPYVTQPGSTVSIGNTNWILRQHGPRYAFQFCGHHQHSQQVADQATAGVLPERQQIQIARVVVKHIVPQVIATAKDRKRRLEGS